MPESNQGASPNAHLLVGEMPAPAQLHSRWGVLTGGSVLPLLALILAAIIASRVPGVQSAVQNKLHETFDIVWLQQKGPGGGGGGGGNQMQEPPRKAELPGKDKITVPVPKPKNLEPVEKPKDIPPPVQKLEIPAQTMIAGVQQLPGVVQGMPSQPVTTSQGSGTQGGAGTGAGGGVGSGSGSGLGDGSGGGSGGGVYQIGNGVSEPILIREVKPQYTGDAMRAKLQGVVEMDAVVLPDGSVGRVQVTRSLDHTFGLDQEAVKAVKQWRFRPGMLKGSPVAVLVTVELTFTLR